MSIKQLYYTLLGVLAAGGATIAQFFGGWDAALQMLCILMASDYGTGLACALVWHKSPKTKTGAYSSNISLKGLIRKGTILLVVLIAYQLDLIANASFIRITVIIFFIANEGLSVVENLGVIGVPIPPVFKEAFDILKQRGNEKISKRK